MARHNQYSRLVGGLKVVLPIAALALLSTLFLLSDPPDPDRALPYAEVDVAQLARELAADPTPPCRCPADGREVTLVAEAAAPDFETTNVIVTDRIEGRIAMSDDAFLFLDAGAGRIDVEGRIADLTGGVEARNHPRLPHPIRHHPPVACRSGHERASGGAPRGTGPDAGRRAPWFWAGRHGAAVLSFTGGVRLIYEPTE
jgi:lipopolysaccharide export system protein LptC